MQFILDRTQEIFDGSVIVNLRKRYYDNQIEYFAFVYFLLLFTVLFLIPFPSVRNRNLSFLLRIMKSFCLTVSLVLPYYYYIFLINEAYSYYFLDNEFMETREAISIIFAALLFATFFHWENTKEILK